MEQTQGNLPAWQRTGGEWNGDIPRMAYQMALLGHTEDEMARVIGVSQSEFRRWTQRHPELQLAVWQGRDEADARVAESWFKCATGYPYEEDYVANYKGEVTVVRVQRYSKPDAEAARKWLAARQRQRWGDVQRVESTQTIISVNRYDYSHLTTAELTLAKKLGMLPKAEDIAEN